MIGAPQPLVLAKPAAIDTAQAARYFGARGEPDDRTMTLLETCAMPLLAAVSSAAGVVGGWAVCVPMIGIDTGSFWSQMQSGVDVWVDVGNGVVKSVVFGFAVSFIALLQGYEAQATPEGVAHATTRTVVVGSLTVLVLDFVLTAMMLSI